jgi:adenylate cyclase
MFLLKIIDASGRQWQYELKTKANCSIGRALDNSVTLEDPRVSRHHAFIKHIDNEFAIVDGVMSGFEAKRSSNKVLVNGQQHDECRLRHGDRITIGASRLTFIEIKETAPRQTVQYSDVRLGHTQLAVPVNEIIRGALGVQAVTPHDEIEALRRKADILALLYELSNTLGSTFDLNNIFDKATDIIFRVTPADRVVALLRDERSGEATVLSRSPPGRAMQNSQGKSSPPLVAPLQTR